MRGCMFRLNVHHLCSCKLYIYVFAGERSHLVLVGSSVTLDFEALAKYEASSVKLRQA